MKKAAVLILSVILCLGFTACGTNQPAAGDSIPADGTFTAEEYVFDLAECDDEKFVQSIKDGRRYDLFSIEGSGIIALGTEVDEKFDNGAEYQVMSYKQLDFENLVFTGYADGDREVPQNAVRWFDYKGKQYALTMENGEYDEKKGGVFPHLVLTDGGKSIAISENWDYMQIVTAVNGYIIFVEKPTEEKDVADYKDFTYKIYSIDKNEFLYEAELKNCAAADNYAYLVNWYNYDTERYLHFDCVSGQLLDVTEQYKRFREKHPQLDSTNPTEYQYFADDAFYTFMGSDGWTLFAEDARIDHIKHADLADKALYYCKADKDKFKVVKIKF